MERRSTSFLEKLPLGRGQPLLVYGATIAICCIALGVRLLAEPIMPAGYPYVSFFPAVVISTFLFGARPGIVAGVLCGLLAWYYFIPAYHSLEISGASAFTLLFYALVVAIDIAIIDWMQRAHHSLADERERSQRLAERGEVLFRELQHRVSNNLQVVGGLLTLQMRSVDDGPARLALSEASRRLGLIGRIHRQLYDPHGEQLHLVAFLDQIVADLIDTSGKTGIAYVIDSSEEVDLPPEAAVPIALIAAEAISNAIEHGFAERDSGQIMIRVLRSDAGLDVSIIDDGAGLPPGFDVDLIDSLGLRLARMLARQLGGAFSLSTGDRTVALLRLP